MKIGLQGWASSCLLAVLLLGTLAGCLGAGDGGEADANAAAGPDLAYESREAPRPVLITPAFHTPAALGPAGRGAEPTIAVGPGGTVYVEDTGLLWRSLDAGATFEPVGQPFCSLARVPLDACPGQYVHHDAGLDGGGDGDVAVDADGRLYWVGLSGESGSVPFQTSDDRGQSWTAPRSIAGEDPVDRQWIDVLPDGTVHVIVRNFNRGLALYTSWDRGTTWNEAIEVAWPIPAGPVVHDPVVPDKLYIPFLTRSEVRVARSSDAGRTWANTSVAVVEPGPSIPVLAPSGWQTAGMPVAAVDTAGTVYVVWTAFAEGLGAGVFKDAAVPVVFLSRSTDGGETWSPARALSDPDHAALFPWIEAGRPGRVVVVWYENENGMPSERVPDLWNVRVIQTVSADSDEMEVAQGFANDEPIRLGTICTDASACGMTAKDRSALDFFQVDLLANGMPIVAYTVSPDPITPVIGFQRVSVQVAVMETGTPLW